MAKNTTRHSEPTEFAKGLMQRAGIPETSQRTASAPKDEPGFNGWKNYETWAVALWIDNTQSTQQEAYAIIAENPDENAAAQAFKEWIEDGNPLSEAGSLYSDLLNAALSEVDWYEVAKHYRNE